MFEIIDCWWCGPASCDTSTMISGRSLCCTLKSERKKKKTLLITRRVETRRKIARFCVWMLKHGLEGEWEGVEVTFSVRLVQNQVWGTAPSDLVPYRHPRPVHWSSAESISVIDRFFNPSHWPFVRPSFAKRPAAAQTSSNLPSQTYGRSPVCLLECEGKSWK